MPSVTLKTPIILPGGRQYALIDIPEATIGGLAAHEMALAETGSETTALIAMLCAETGWPNEAVSKIRVSDLEAVSGLLRPFLGSEKPGLDGGASPPMSPTS